MIKSEKSSHTTYWNTSKKKKNHLNHLIKKNINKKQPVLTEDMERKGIDVLVLNIIFQMLNLKLILS